jgi:GntR family transcriptional repressor for pyruvate dehydrogenase complex
VSTLTTSDALAPLDVPSAAQAVAERLRRAIHLGTFGVGERLPAERELASRLCVSRTTVREALQELERSGYLVRIPGTRGGPVVAGKYERTAALRRRLPEFDELMEFRAVVEGAAAGAAAERRAAGDLRPIEDAVQAIAAAGEIAAFRRADSDFHLAVARAAGNAPLAAAIGDARERMFAPVDALGFPLLAERSRREHRRISEAIAAGRATVAQRRMADHIRASRAELREALDPTPYG